MKTLYISIRDNDWVIILLVSSLFLLNILRLVFPSLFHMMLNTNKKNSFSNFFIKKKNSIFNWFFGIIEMMFYMHFALFIFSLSDANYSMFNFFVIRINYWSVLFLMFSFYFIKRLLIHFVFYVFDKNHIGKFYVAYKIPLHFFLFVFLMIFNSLIYFSPFPLSILMIMVMCVFVISYTYLYVLFVLKNYSLIKNNLFLFFFYFCTLEVLPLLFFGKAVIF